MTSGAWGFADAACRLLGGINSISALRRRASSAGSDISLIVKYASEEKVLKIHWLSTDWNAAQPIVKVVDSPRRY